MILCGIVSVWDWLSFPVARVLSAPLTTDHGSVHALAFDYAGVGFYVWFSPSLCCATSTA